MKKGLLITCCALLSCLQIFAQLGVSPEANDTVFAYSLAGPGVLVSNIVRTCADDASGYFNSMDANVGIDSGVVLTTGSIFNAVGPNNNSAISTATGTDGDADLSEASGYSTYDACALEFDMTVAADTVRIDYVFASEEYEEFVGSAFNDIFAFWVSGPDIPDPVNIALVPGTDLPVAINNVNQTDYSDYYIHNGGGYEDPYDTDAYYIQYDGMTTMLEGKIACTPGETYHMKIAVADASDEIFDSGVFLKTGSLGSLRLLADTWSDDGSGMPAAEGCSDGHITFTNYYPSATPLVLDYYIGGTAVNGVDFETIPSEITIPAYDSSYTLNIIPINDGITEGAESVTLYLYNPESMYVYDSVTMNIEDGITLDNFNEVSSGLTADFEDISGIATSWLWDFGDGSTSTDPSPEHTYADPGVYSVCLTITNDAGCSATYCEQVSVTSLGIQSAALDALTRPFPDPAGHTIAFGIPQNGKAGIARIENMLGQTMMEKTLENSGSSICTMDCSSLAPGMYVLQISYDGNTVAHSFEKQ